MATLAICTVPTVVPPMQREGMPAVASGIKNRTATGQMPIDWLAGRVAHDRKPVRDAVEAALVDVHAVVLADRTGATRHDCVRAFRS